MSEVPDIDKYVTGVASNGGDAPAGGTVATKCLDGLGSASGQTEGGNQPVITKLLLSNSAAGSVIGKAGSSIEQLQRSSGARLQLSRAGEFFPGTSDRVLLLSGTLHSVLTAIFLILEKVSKDSASAAAAARARGQYREDTSNGENTVKLALSRKLCGLLIGHKGATVRDFIADSGSTIRVQSLNELTPSDPERTIAVSGARDQVLRAVALILNTLSLDESFGSYMDGTLQVASSQGVVLPPRSGGARSVLANVRASLTLYLPDDDVGAVLGKKGQNLVEIQQNSRVSIKISDREKMDPETKEREVTLAGPYAAVKLAEAMVAEKLQQQSHARASRDGRDDDDRSRRGGGSRNQSSGGVAAGERRPRATPVADEAEEADA